MYEDLTYEGVSLNISVTPFDELPPCWEQCERCKNYSLRFRMCNRSADGCKPEEAEY